MERNVLLTSQNAYDQHSPVGLRATNAPHLEMRCRTESFGLPSAGEEATSESFGFLEGSSGVRGEVWTFDASGFMRHKEQTERLCRHHQFFPPLSPLFVRWHVSRFHVMASRRSPLHSFFSRATYGCLTLAMVLRIFAFMQLHVGAAI